MPQTLAVVLQCVAVCCSVLNWNFTCRVLQFATHLLCFALVAISPFGAGLPIHIYTHTQSFTNMHVCVCVCVCIYVYICIHIHVHIYTYIYIHIYEHIYI